MKKTLGELKRRFFHGKAAAQPREKTQDEIFKDLIEGRGVKKPEIERKAQVDTARMRAKPVETIKMTPEERRERERRKLFARLGGRN